MPPITLIYSIGLANLPPRLYNCFDRDMAPDFSFHPTYYDKATGARTGLINTAHGSFETPVFMPVGTNGTVKALTQGMLEEVDAAIVLGNTYHLYLRPGHITVNNLGGLHRFMGWSRSL